MKNLIYSALAVTILFTACKYEEGPGISLRSKRDRVANEWKVDNYTYTPKGGSAQDKTDLYNVKGDTLYSYFTYGVPYQSDAALDSAKNNNPWGDSTVKGSTYTINDYHYIMVFTRTGFYSIQVIDQNNNSVNPRHMAKYVQESDNRAPDPLNINKSGRSGEWSFIYKSSKIQVKNDLAGSNYTAEDIKAGRSAPIVFDIVKLSNKEMKLKAEDVDGGKHEYTLKSFHEDKYLK